MKGVAREQLLDLTAYERIRPEFLERTIALKRPRRISVGDRLTFIFENRDTVLFQIQEMLRAERQVKEEKIQDEIAVYNELVPGADELSATLMIEIPEQKQIRSELDRLIGIDEHVILDVGGEAVRATFDPKQFESDRISAVQYVRFPLGSALARKFREPELPVALRVEHPNYRHSTPLTGESRRSLLADLCSD
ncbi:MAG TPA: DUF3501 family protein [Myxococcota bacterium]|nr:DUF3501 family protein [Myxococcota bacterium]